MMLKRFIKKRNENNKETTGFRLLEVIIIMIICILFGMTSTLYVMYPHLEKRNNKTEINEDFKEIASVFEIVTNNYYEEVDKNALKEAAIEGMLKYLGDNNTYYFDEGEKNDFDERMNGEYHGIGVELVTDINGDSIIVNVFPNTPAYENGLKVGDVIKAVDDQDATKMTSADIASYIKESDIKSVDLKIERNKEIIEVNIAKQKVIINSVTSDIFERKNKKIGYLNISVFAINTYQQFRNEVISLEEAGVDSFIIDVRSNAGGYLDIVVDMIEMFLEEEQIVYQMEANNEITTYYDKTEEARDSSVVVLINEQSASASEILAAAFKEIYGSEIVGVKSFGKGTVQETRELENGGMIKITTQKWLTPNGNSIEKEGIEPTFEIQMDEKYYKNPTYENDNQLQKALSLIK
ncbi:MAG: S41 family peptidase [Bacilli bacterium]|nr:S41 family peptidase [Bacilli bacterium]